MITTEQARKQAFYAQAEYCHRGGCRQRALLPTGQAHMDDNGVWWEDWRCHNCGYVEGKLLDYQRRSR